MTVLVLCNSIYDHQFNICGLPNYPQSLSLILISLILFFASLNKFLFTPNPTNIFHLSYCPCLVTLPSFTIQRFLLNEIPRDGISTTSIHAAIKPDFRWCNQVLTTLREYCDPGKKWHGLGWIGICLK